MENASKALIIAGAILLSILIIALGMRIFNSASSSAEGASLDAQELSAHNSKFEAYTGKQKGSQVTALINAIQKNNGEYEDRAISVAFSNTIDKRSTWGNNPNPSGSNFGNGITPAVLIKKDGTNVTDEHQILASTNKTYNGNESVFNNAYSYIRGLVLPNVTYSVDLYYYNSIVAGIEIYVAN